MTKVIVFVTYESPWFPAGGIAAVMGKLPCAVEAAANLPTVVITPFHYESRKLAALEKQTIQHVAMRSDDNCIVVSVLHSKIDCPWYFLQPDEAPPPAEGRFFGGRSHPYDVSKEILLRDSLFFGEAVVHALPTIAEHLGIPLEEVEWNLVAQDWESATAALAFASQGSCRGRLHLTLHNSYDAYASDADYRRVGINPQRCPGDTILHRALNLIEQPAFTVSEQFAEDFTHDLLQREIMAPHLQSLLNRDTVVGIDNEPFKLLAVREEDR
jgi:hypothetical protein